MGRDAGLSVFISPDGKKVHLEFCGVIAELGSAQAREIAQMLEDAVEALEKMNHPGREQ